MHSWLIRALSEVLFIDTTTVSKIILRFGKSQCASAPTTTEAPLQTKQKYRNPSVSSMFSRSATVSELFYKRYSGTLLSMGHLCIGSPIHSYSSYMCKMEKMLPLAVQNLSHEF